MKKVFSPIRLAILEDHQGIVDGYKYRLSRSREIAIEAVACYGSELEYILKTHPINLVLLDVHVRTAPDNPNPYPITQMIPKFLKAYPGLRVAVISMDDQGALIRSVMEAGACGYILKDDRDTINELGSILVLIAKGGIYLSRQAHEKLQECIDNRSKLSHRQLEALMFCAANPQATTAELARHLGVADSTIRNLLSGAYLKLGVNSRVAAISEAWKLGLISQPGTNLVDEPQVFQNSL